MRERLIIGTRGSKLALWQAHFVQERLGRLTDARIEILAIKTTGDRNLQAPADQLSKGIFTKEIEEALLAGEIDIAVHSMKDLPTELPKGLDLGAVCAREDVRDALISKDGSTLNSLPSGSSLGTSSLRRSAQLMAYRPDLVFVDLRGNVDTRLRKLREGQFDALVLAKAGLDRLGLTDEISQVLPADIMLPAAGQGALAVEVRDKDDEILELLQSLNHPPSQAGVLAERALLKILEGGCQVPIGAWGRVEDKKLVLEGCVVSPDGRLAVRDRIDGPIEDSSRLGVQLANRLLAQGADRILQEVDAYRDRKYAGRDEFVGS